jgi:hypothetical protein
MCDDIVLFFCVPLNAGCSKLLVYYPHILKI